MDPIGYIRNCHTNHEAFIDSIDFSHPIDSSHFAGQDTFVAPEVKEWIWQNVVAKGGKLMLETKRIGQTSE